MNSNCVYMRPMLKLSQYIQYDVNTRAMMYAFQFWFPWKCSDVQSSGYSRCFSITECWRLQHFHSHTYTYKHAYTSYTHAHIYTYMHTIIHTCTHIYKCTHASNVYTGAHMHIQRHTYKQIHICTSIHAHAITQMHIHKPCIHTCCIAHTCTCIHDPQCYKLTFGIFITDSHDKCPYQYAQCVSNRVMVTTSIRPYARCALNGVVLLTNR